MNASGNKATLTRWGRRYARDERGGVLALVAVSMVGILGIAGLALDSSRAYVAKAQLSRAVDSAALGGAAALREGQSAASQRIESLARANGVDPGVAGQTLNYAFGVNENGENTVVVSATRVVPTTFMRVLGRDQVDVVSEAEATVPPLDIVLVLDQSGSLGTQNAWDDLQRAAKDFTDKFDESIDQMGLVSFQIRAAEHVRMQSSFKSQMRLAIDLMNSAGDTNTGEGLRLGKLTIDGNPRPGAARVIVFFTDGRPTAFRGQLGGEDRVMAVSTVIQNRVRGYFDNPDLLSMQVTANPPSGCRGAPSCFGMNENAVRNQGRLEGLRSAQSIRQDGIFIYSIGLGNPNANDPILQPDMDYLREISNEDGQTDSGEPRGKAYFAPSAAELDDVFNAVAADLLVRLTK